MAPESKPSLLEQGQKHAGDLAVTVEAPSTDQITADLTVGMTGKETWGEWFVRVGTFGKWKRGEPTNAGAKVEGGIKW